MSPISREDVTVAVTDRDGGAVVRLRVVPRAPRTALVGRHGPALKLRVKAPPVEGAANAEVMRFLADACGVRVGDVTLLQGERSRDKVAFVSNRDAAEVSSALVAASG